MPSNIIGPLPKKSDTPIEKVRKSSGDLDDIKKELITTIYTVDKEGITYMVDKIGKRKPNVVHKDITSPISEKKKIDTVKKTQKSQASKKTVDTSKRNKNDTIKTIHKSESNQITDTVNTVDKSRSIPGTNLSYISTRIEKPTEIDIVKYNKDLSDLSLQ